jgi:predicted transcriptional regulator
MNTPDHGEAQGPIVHVFFSVDTDLHQRVRDAADEAGCAVAVWLRHLMRQITVADFPESWQATAWGSTRHTTPRATIRTHDSRDYDQRFMLRLDRATRVTLQQLTEHFRQSKAAIIRQLIAQLSPADFPERWQLAAAARQGRLAGQQERDPC